METKTPTKAPLLSWTAPVAPEHQRSKRWYICAMAAVSVLVIYSLFAQAWTFTIILVLSSVMYWKIHRDPPVQKNIAIWDTGFQIGNEYTAWSECNSYWMLQGENYVELHIERNLKFKGNVLIQTGNISFQEIREVLSRFIPENTTKTEGLLDTIIRLCKI